MREALAGDRAALVDRWTRPCAARAVNDGAFEQELGKSQALPLEERLALRFVHSRSVRDRCNFADDGRTGAERWSTEPSTAALDDPPRRGEPLI